MTFDEWVAASSVLAGCPDEAEKSDPALSALEQNSPRVVHATTNIHCGLLCARYRSTKICFIS